MKYNGTGKETKTSEQCLKYKIWENENSIGKKNGRYILRKWHSRIVKIAMEKSPEERRSIGPLTKRWSDNLYPGRQNRKETGSQLKQKKKKFYFDEHSKSVHNSCVRKRDNIKLHFPPSMNHPQDNEIDFDDFMRNVCCIPLRWSISFRCECIIYKIQLSITLVKEIFSKQLISCLMRLINYR